MSPFIIPVVAVALLLFRTTPEPDRAILLPDADEALHLDESRTAQ